MSLDVVILLILLAFALLGYVSGALAQLFGLVSLVVAYVVSKPAGPVVARFLMERYEHPPSVAAVTGRIVAGIGIYIVCKLIFLLANLYLGRREVQSRIWNRGWGAGLSVVKAVAVVWLVACLLAEGSKLQFQLPWDIQGRVNDSRIATWMVNTYNPVASLRVMTMLSDLRRISQHPQAIRQLTDDPQVKAFLDKLRTAIMTRIREDKLAHGVEEGDPAAIVQYARLRDFLGNEQLLEQLLRIDLERAVDKALKALPEQD